jgi:hypothetical protein
MLLLTSRRRRRVIGRFTNIFLTIRHPLIERRLASCRLRPPASRTDFTGSSIQLLRRNMGCVSSINASVPRVRQMAEEPGGRPIGRGVAAVPGRSTDHPSEFRRRIVQVPVCSAGVGSRHSASQGENFPFAADAAAALCHAAQIVCALPNLFIRFIPC